MRTKPGAADEGVLQAEKDPGVLVGPVCEPGPEGAETLERWFLTQHVELCAKGGVDCRTCDRAEEKGIPRAVSS